MQVIEGKYQNFDPREIEKSFEDLIASEHEARVKDIGAYEFAKFEHDKTHIYCLIDTSNPMHLKMYLTQEIYDKTPEFRQKLYKVCS